MSKTVKKSLIYSLIGIAAVACNNIVPEPSLSVPLEGQQALRMADKPSVRPPAKSSDILIIQPDTLKSSAIKSDNTGTKNDSSEIKPEEGERIFKFYAVTPPDINFEFPSHSIVMIPVSQVGVDKGVANSFCEYWLYTKSGELVCYCKNTVSGLHPVYGNSFNANNHLPEFTKKIGFGEYRLVYKNISKAPVKQDLICGLIANNGKDQVDTKVLSGETKEYWINIYPSNSEFKLNNNNKEPM